jgi:hypothetical protein
MKVSSGTALTCIGMLALAFGGNGSWLFIVAIGVYIDIMYNGE